MMKSPQHLATLAFLVLPITASAQHPAARATHPGGAAVHRGAMPRQLHPSQQHPAMSDYDIMIRNMQQEADYYDQRRATKQRGTRPQPVPNGQPSMGQRASGSQGGMNTPVQAQPSGSKPRQGASTRPQTKPGAQRSNSSANAAEKSRSEGSQGSDKARRREAEAAEKEKARRDHNASVEKGKAKEAIRPNRLPLAADQAIISLLRTSHAKLQKADHDYQGHRVRAMHHVASALQHLGVPGAFDARFASSLGDLPQAESDRILREAVIHLGSAETSLGSRDATHHRSAHTSVAEAIRELHVALNIR